MDATITHVEGAPGLGAVRRFVISVVEGPAAGTSWTSSGRSCTIGSHPRCDLVLDDPTVSRFHCELQVDDHGLRVRDTASRNGTSLDGVRIVEAFLRAGSRLRVGRSVIQVEIGGERVQLPLSKATSFGGMVGVSVAMRSAFAVLERAAASDATVLLGGETGTGKTLAARSLHDESERRDGPFVIVDCGAIPSNLLESELFGHEKGAFTGAETRRIGAFEEANGGTVFLDEIGELPLELQPKLLGVLEGRQVKPVGASTHRAVDVRLIAATNRDLRTEVNDSRFRSDLYYRLAVVTMTMPSLRERPEDIAALAERVLESLGADRQRIDRLLVPEMITKISAAAWPGNIRELKNYLERCLVFDEAMPLADAGGQLDDGTDELDGVDTSLLYADARQRTLDRFERIYLRAQLRAHNDVVSRAAAAAGMDRTYFYRLLRRHGIRK